MVEFLGGGPNATGPLEQQVAELRDIIHRQAAELQEFRTAFLTVTYVEPDRPREGMIRFADGTSWDPGAGVGYYQYAGGVWSGL